MIGFPDEFGMKSCNQSQAKGDAITLKQSQVIQTHPALR